jgi:hypothetical protein
MTCNPSLDKRALLWKPLRLSKWNLPVLLDESSTRASAMRSQTGSRPALGAEPCSAQRQCVTALTVALEALTRARVSCRPWGVVLNRLRPYTGAFPDSPAFIRPSCIEHREYERLLPVVSRARGSALARRQLFGRGSSRKRRKRKSTRSRATPTMRRRPVDFDTPARRWRHWITTWRVRQP